MALVLAGMAAVLPSAAQAIGPSGQVIDTSGIYKDRSPIDCKALQSALKYKFNLRELPSNMIPVSQLEAILGAYLGLIMATNSTEYNCKVKTEYQGIEVIGIDM